MKYFKNNNLEKKKVAFEKAHDIRKFEIDLYWKRATYFWAFIASTFTAYFILIASDKINNVELYVFLVTSIGIIFSLGWYLVNRGSKHWQLNWEKIIDQIEDDISGPLMKTTWNNENKFCNLTLSNKYSVSKINQIISLYITLLWFLLAIKEIIEIYNNYKIDFYGNYIFLVNLIILIIFVYMLLNLGKSDKTNEKGHINNVF
jgi:hypothetical protein